MFRANARLAILAAIGLWACAPAAQAAWLGYKNVTKSPIVVQTTMVINNQVVRGKAHVLYPGEIAWDNIPAPSTRQLSIYDPKANNKLIYQDTVTVANQDIFLGVQSVVPPAQPGKPAPPPQIRLVVTKAPVKPGVVQAQPKAGQPQGKATTPAQPAKPTQPVPAKPKEQPKPATPPKQSGKSGK